MPNLDKCAECNSLINKKNFYIGSNDKYYCSSKCFAKSNNNDEGIHIVYCVAYDACKQLNNTRSKCIFKENVSNNNIWAPYTPKYPNFCESSEISMILSNVKLLNFVEEKEKNSAELNNKTLALTQDNVKLAKAMLIVSFINLFLIIIQICLQFN